MTEEKIFLTYNQQMKRLRNNKKIDCHGSKHKTNLVRAGYFNIINGYKNPFICGIDVDGNHIYIRDTSIEQLYKVKQFDEALRSLLLRYITQVEEEVRTLTGYKFDECNENGNITWYDTNAYASDSTLQNRMNTISAAYSELSKSRLDYVKFYMNNHKQIPTWIMIKVINFSTFIDVLKFSKKNVSHSICNLYGMKDSKGLPNVKLLIGSLHWMRRVRNSCAHNERIYCLSHSRDRFGKSGRISEKYLQSLRKSYCRDTDQRLFDLLVYFKYYLPCKEYEDFIDELYEMLVNLKEKLQDNSFSYVRGNMGIKNIDDLLILKALPKNEIEYNKFDKKI